MKARTCRNAANARAHGRVNSRFQVHNISCLAAVVLQGSSQQAGLTKPRRPACHPNAEDVPKRLELVLNIPLADSAW